MSSMAWDAWEMGITTSFGGGLKSEFNDDRPRSYAVKDFEEAAFEIETEIDSSLQNEVHKRLLGLWISIKLMDFEVIELQASRLADHEAEYELDAETKQILEAVHSSNFGEAAGLISQVVDVLDIDFEE